MAEPTVVAVIEAVGADRGDVPAIIHADGVTTWPALLDRTHRLANALTAIGAGCHTERDQLAGHESGQSHLGIYLHNGPQYLESMIGAWMARVAPFNINYRYRERELAALFADARPDVVVVHSTFAATLTEALALAGRQPVVWQVPDRSDAPLAPGARWYGDVLAEADRATPALDPSPDDLYILYTGGTTGRPKGVLWRNADALVECFAGIRGATDPAAYSLRTRAGRGMPTPPFMHGAGHWSALRTLTSGGTVVLPERPDRFDAADVLRTIERHGVNATLIVGDSFADPILRELGRRSYDLSTLNVIISGGAALSDVNKQRLTTALPTVMVLDGLGASEAGGQLTRVSTFGVAPPPRFAATTGNHVLDADRSRLLAPGDDEVGWLAKTGQLALGYLGDPEGTARTYPTIDGVRYCVPGDRATLAPDGQIVVLGREATTVNTGGEKVFVEEVESALKHHADVVDCLVVGRPSERWGHEVVAVVQVAAGSTATDDELRDAVRDRLAGYKVPRALFRVEGIQRSPAGKPDYAWARSVVAGSP